MLCLVELGTSAFEQGVVSGGAGLPAEHPFLILENSFELLEVGL